MVGQKGEEHLVRLLAFHHFEAVENLSMRGAFPNGENHGFAEPAFDAELGERAEAAVNFHGPFRGVHGKFRGPVFGEMRDQPEEMIAIGIGRALHPHLVEEADGFPGESKCGTE